jgi:hypothetical protein
MTPDERWKFGDVLQMPGEHYKIIFLTYEPKGKRTHYEGRTFVACHISGSTWPPGDTTGFWEDYEWEKVDGQ